MAFLYKRAERDFQFLRYVDFIGICSHEYHLQIKTEFILCVSNRSHRIFVFDSLDVYSIDISDTFMLGSYQFRTTN